MTGGTGFVGSAMSRQLLAQGADVRLLAQPGSAVDHLDPAVEVIQGDVSDPAAARRAARGVRMVFHLAALYRFSAPDPGVFTEVNVIGTRNVIEAATSAGCERGASDGATSSRGRTSGSPTSSRPWAPSPGFPRRPGACRPTSLWASGWCPTWSRAGSSGGSRAFPGKPPG
ncbi:MAG: NAD-dependent epimerase/dehydratase family protein [Actinomycetota bacterium]|nr:NAD-dependent epimerase/dehydratase family protein [Actinomycetota bacterium]